MCGLSRRQGSSEESMLNLVMYKWNEVPCRLVVSYSAAPIVCTFNTILVSSSRPCPICCTCRGGAITVSVSYLIPCKSQLIFQRSRTLGRLTSGMTTTLRALGASLGAILESPPGWYLYLPSVEPVSQGIPSLARPMVASDVDLVGDRPVGHCMSNVSNFADMFPRWAYQSKDQHHPEPGT